MYLLGKRSTTSASTFSMKVNVESVGQKTDVHTPNVSATRGGLFGSPPSAGYTENAARRRVRLAPELRIRRDRRGRVARHLDLGDDVNVPRGGVAHDVTNLVLRIEAAVTRGLVPLRVPIEVVADRRLSAKSSDLRQPWVALDLHPPAVVVGEVPVKVVQLVRRHHVDVPLHLLDREEVA